MKTTEKERARKTRWRQRHPEYHKQWQQKNKGYCSEYGKEYRETNKASFKLYHKQYYENHLKQQEPWIQLIKSIHSRCRPKGYYGRRGIKNHLNADLIKQLWFRDNANRLKEPSIDRIDSKESYTFENCRFIEMRENISLAHLGVKHEKNKKVGGKHVGR